MSDTQTHTRTPADTGAVARTPRRDAPTREAQETRRSVTTTEFYGMIVAVAGLLIAGQIDSSGLDARTSWQLATVVAVAYIVSRGLAKIGSQREHYNLR